MICIGFEREREREREREEVIGFLGGFSRVKSRPGGENFKAAR